MHKSYKIIYWIATILLCCLMLFSAQMYLTKYEMVESFFKLLGYPTYIIYPLATAKILGCLAILIRKSKFLAEWAYAGFFFDLLLAASAHIHVQDDSHFMAIAGLVLLIISRSLVSKAFQKI